MLYDCRQVQDVKMPLGNAMTPSVAAETAKTRPAAEKAQTRNAD